ncbi:MAG: CHAT domain-containing protein [Cyanobacteria bacterium]|nr:CHAT domain-containing protein [Cyanobacteriota bacterium]MDA0866543.1 CHAT domain-containing protein [Cyanobacteriota bacterium]
MAGHNPLTGLLLALVLLGSPIAQAEALRPAAGTLAQVGPSPSEQRAATLRQQVDALYQVGRYAEATPLAERVVAIYRSQGASRAIANALNDLALLYRVQGRYQDAEPLYLEAVDRMQNQLGDGDPLLATLFNNLAALYGSQGRYNEAEPLYLQSLEIDREQLGDRHPSVAASLNNLGWLYRNQGRYAEAEPLYLEALAIIREQLGDRHPNVAHSLNNLASVYRFQGRFNEAERLYRQALGIYRQQLGNRHGAVAANLNNLADLYRIHGYYDEAEPLYLEALEIHQAQLGSQHPRVATSLQNLGLLYNAQGRYDEAEQLYRQALEIRREQLGERHPDVANSLNNLAELYRDQGDLPAAIASLQAGLEVEEWNLDLNLATLTDAQRQAYAAQVSVAIDLTTSLHLQGAPNDDAAAQLALTTLLRRKGRVLDAGTNSRQTLRQHLTAADQALLDQLTATQQRLATLTFNPPSTLSPEQYRTELAELEVTATEQEATLARRSAAFRADAQPVTLRAIQAQMPANGVLIEYVRYQPVNPTAAPLDRLGPDRYGAYLLFADGTITAVDLGSAADIDQAVQAFRQDLQNVTQSPHPAARTLAKLLIDPLQSHLPPAAQLLISPDSQLNRIPFEALRDGEDRYLIEQYPISYLNSGRDLLQFNIVAPSFAPAVIVANPDYDEGLSADRVGPRQRSGLGQLQVGPLPGTALEAEAIQQQLPNATVLTATQATETAIKQVRSPRILHIATHGFFLNDVGHQGPGAGRGLGVVTADETGDWVTDGAETVAVENPLLRSGLALAGFNARSSGDEDGVLTALEASTLDLFGTQLVVLSACETGLGDIANGEGVYGLRRAFAIAGAETQLISLWQVDDYGTQSLMAQYYEQLLSGAGRSEALRQVQLEMITSGSRYAHPYYSRRHLG